MKQDAPLLVLPKCRGTASCQIYPQRCIVNLGHQSLPERIPLRLQELRRRKTVRVTPEHRRYNLPHAEYMALEVLRLRRDP